MTFRSCLGSLVMRADIQRKPLGFQEVIASHYRCVSICVTRLTRSQDVIPRSLVFITTGFLEQPSNTSLLQSGLELLIVLFFVIFIHPIISNFKTFPIWLALPGQKLTLFCQLNSVSLIYLLFCPR